MANEILPTDTDITTKLQAQADDNLVFIPKGDFEISETITFAHQSGLQVQSQGPTSILNGETRAGGGSRLIWTGPAGQPMFDIRTANFEFLGGITFDCNDSASMAIQFTKPQPQPTGMYGPGKMAFVGTLRIENATETALKFGLSPFDSHCDEFRCFILETDNCPKAITVINGQSMKHYIGHAHLYLTPQGFEYQGGGCLVLNSATLLHDCELLILNGQSNQIGRNNARWKISSVKVDNQGSSGFVLVKMLQQALNGMVLADDILVSGDCNNWMDLMGPISVKVSGMTEVPVGGITSTVTNQGAPNVKLEFCQMDDRDPARAFADGRRYSGRAKVVDCFRYPAQDIADIDYEWATGRR